MSTTKRARRLGLASRLPGGEPARTHWTLVAVCLQLRDHDAVLAALERMDALFELAWTDFTKVEAYKQFAGSAQHAQWLAYLAAKK